MNAETKIAAEQVPFTEAYDRLPDREALRLLKTLADRFSGCGYAFDKLAAGIEECATTLARDEGYRAAPHSIDEEGELADMYLSDPVRFGPSSAKVMVALAPVVRLPGGGVVA